MTTSVYAALKRLNRRTVIFNFSQVRCSNPAVLEKFRALQEHCRRLPLFLFKKAFARLQYGSTSCRSSVKSTYESTYGSTSISSWNEFKRKRLQVFAGFARSPEETRNQVLSFPSNVSRLSVCLSSRTWSLERKKFLEAKKVLHSWVQFDTFVSNSERKPELFGRLTWTAWSFRLHFALILCSVLHLQTSFLFTKIVRYSVATAHRCAFLFLSLFVNFVNSGANSWLIRSHSLLVCRPAKSNCWTVC